MSDPRDKGHYKYRPGMLDPKYISVDMGDMDYSVVQTYRRPGKIRMLLRKLGIDKSTWEYKLIKTTEKISCPKK